MISLGLSVSTDLPGKLETGLHQYTFECVR